MLNAWHWEGQVLAAIFEADRFPTHLERTGFYHYEGVPSPLSAQYEYCELGGVTLILPNVKHRSQKFRRLAWLATPWGPPIVFQDKEVGETLIILPTLGDEEIGIALIK